jgi:hypothetical protein
MMAMVVARPTWDETDDKPVVLPAQQQPVSSATGDFAVMAPGSGPGLHTRATRAAARGREFVLE